MCDREYCDALSGIIFLFWVSFSVNFCRHNFLCECPKKIKIAVFMSQSLMQSYVLSQQI